MKIYNIVAGSKSTIGGAPIYARRSATHTSSKLVYGNGMGLKSLVAAFYLLFKRPDLVVIHDMSGFYYTLFPKFIRAPYIYNSLGLWKRYFVGMKHKNFLQQIKSRIAIFVEKHVIKKSECVITISDQIKYDVINYYGVDKKLIHVIYPGSSDTFYNKALSRSSRIKIRQKYNIGEDKFVIIFIGQDFVRKGLKELIDAVSCFDKLYLIVIGNERNDTFNKSVKKILNLGVSNRFIFEKTVPNIDEYLYASDMLVLPAHYDPFGMVVTEAMAHRLPVVVSINAGASELIKDGLNGFVINKIDWKTVASKIILVKNKNLMERVSKKCLETAKSIRWETQGMKYKKIYNSVVRNRRSFNNIYRMNNS